MSGDATFEDGAPRALRLIAERLEDLEVISSLVQDAVLSGADMSWDPARRRFSMLVNRFRWEANVDMPERTRALLVIDDVSRVASQGVDRRAGDLVYAILSLAWGAAEDGTGQLLITLAGDGAINLDAETINVTLQDVTQPYRAVSGKTPKHPD